MALNRTWANRLIADLTRDFGLSVPAAQGIVGSLAMESKGFTDWQEDAPVIPGSRGGGGMAQWTGVRRKAYENYAASNNLDLDSYEAQYGYLRAELRGAGRHDRNVIQKIVGLEDAGEAAKVFTNTFLRPGKPHMSARLDWTNQVASNYVKLPPGEIPEYAVGTQIDVNRPDPKAAPIPQPRSKAVDARANASLQAIQGGQGVSMPRARPETNPTDGLSLSVPTEFAPNGKPRDPKTGFLLDTSATQAKLPALSPPMTTKEIMVARDFEREQGIKQLDRTTNPLTLRIPPSKPSQAQDAQNARDEILASEAARVEPNRTQRKPDASIIERSTQKAERPLVPQSGIERSKPNGPATRAIPDVSRIAETLPSGSNPKATSAANIAAQRDEQRLTRKPAGVLTVAVQPRVETMAKPARTVPGQSIIERTRPPELPKLPVQTIVTKPTVAAQDIPSKNKAKGTENIFESILGSVSDMFGGDSGGDPFKSMGKALSYTPRENTAKVQANVNKGMTSAQAYEATNQQAKAKAEAGATKGHSTQGGMKYNADSGGWDYKGK